MTNPSAIGRADRVFKREAEPAVKTPPLAMSFHEWLHTYAMVRVGNEYRRYSVEGRQPLFVAILITDYVLGNDVSYADEATRLAVLGTLEYGTIIQDAILDVCGGAQFGKTILALLFKVYMGTVKFRGVMYCLPDDDLVQGIIDMKERPEVLEQIPYVGAMLEEGKDISKVGRPVNRKGAMLYTDGSRTAVSMMRGLGKFPTSFSADAVVVDEMDDVNEEYADFLPGRMTSSDLRFLMHIGTQRYDGAGQNGLYLEGSQHVGYFTCPECGRRHNPEEEWPGIARLSVTGDFSPEDPRLDDAGNFVDAEGRKVAKYKPEYTYYFACVDCGAPLDREAIVYEARQPERIPEHRWSVRVSQMCCSALPVRMFVSDWCTNAVKQKKKRASFATDRLAIPSSADQKLTPAILDKSARVEPYIMALNRAGGYPRFAGLDTGDLCYFTVREDMGAERKRLLWAEQMADSDVRRRAVQLVHTMGVGCLFVDAGPLRDLARWLALKLNNLESVKISRVEDWEKKRIRFKGGVEWDGHKGVWLNLRCATVEFSLKPGAGVQQQARLTPDNEYIYPVISCNRDEAIAAVVDELLTAEDGLAEVSEATGELRTVPVMRLPDANPNGSGVMEVLRRHYLVGSRKEKDKDGKEEHFVDGVPNHYLLSSVYARLAETVGARYVGGTTQAGFRRFGGRRASRVVKDRRRRCLDG